VSLNVCLGHSRNRTEKCVLGNYFVHLDDFSHFYAKQYLATAELHVMFVHYTNDAWWSVRQSNMPNCTWPYLDQSQSRIAVGHTTMWFTSILSMYTQNSLGWRSFMLPLILLQYVIRQLVDKTVKVRLSAYIADKIILREQTSCRLSVALAYSVSCGHVSNKSTASCKVLRHRRELCPQ